MRMHRRRVNRKGMCTFTTQSAQKYIKHRVNHWLYTVMTSGATVEDDFFVCFGAVNNGLQGIARILDTHLENHSVYGLSVRKRDALREELKSTSAKRYASFFEDIWEKHSTLHTDFQEILFPDNNPKTPAVPRDIKKAHSLLAEHLGCSEDMITFLEFVFILRTHTPVERYFEDSISIHDRSSLPLLAKMLSLTDLQLRQIINEACTCGFIQDGVGDCFHLSPLVEKLWDADTGGDFEDLIYKKFPEKSLSLDAFHVPEEEKKHILHLLSCQSDEPIHILLYGAAGTGKTTFAHSLAAELGTKAWSVASLEEDDENDRRAALVACTRLAAKVQGSFVLLDEAERLLDTDAGTSFGHRATKDKAWLNSFLEKKGRRIIWITNQISHVDRAVRRRFSYSLHFEELTLEQRQAAWAQIIQDEKVSARISQTELKALVQKYPVAVAVAAKAVCQAKLLKYKKGDFSAGMERILAAHITLDYNGKKPKAFISTADKNYTLDGVTLEQGQQHSIESIMQKVYKLDQILKRGDMPKGGGSMLFYGPPGTGKSALAQYMAQELGRECVIKKASDLLSMYVGEAEKNIAAAFAEAEANGYILVIDEADSFMYSRESATRSWEVTQVNEFLTQLEAFKGICVCTSNRRTSMDAAAMRRFSFKIPFAYAGAEQVEKLYVTILAPLCKQELTEKQRKALLSCKSLAPGDFAAVRSQFWLDDDINHTKLIEALIREQKSKLDSVGKVMGFQ